MVHLDYLGIQLKRERIVIKCDATQLKKRFKRFAVDYKDYEAALRTLLDLADDKGYVLRR